MRLWKVHRARVLSALLILTLLPLAGCTPPKPAFKFAFQPIMLPIVFGIDTNGNISAEPRARLQTPIGHFSIEVSTNIIDPVTGDPGPNADDGAKPGDNTPPIPRPDGGRILILRDRNQSPGEVDTVTPLDFGDEEPIHLDIDSRSTVEIARYRIIVDITQVRCFSMWKTTRPDADKVERCQKYSSRTGWVKNHLFAEMWSGPEDQEGVISFGLTSHQFCSFLKIRPEHGNRVLVLNPYTDQPFWINLDAIGPVDGPPDRKAEPNPPDHNCAEHIFDR